MIRRLFLSALLILVTTCPSLAQFASQMEWAGTAGGSSNAITLTVPNATSLADLLGVPLRFVPSNTNTAATTIAVNGFTAKPVKRASLNGLVALTGGEIVTSQPIVVMWDGTEFDVMSSFFSFPTPKNIQVLTAASGTYTPTAGAQEVLVFATAGGGSGGGGAPSMNGQGGGAGGTAITLVNLSGIATVPYVVGQGGAAITSIGQDGADGGLTTFGSPAYAAAAGGQGGSGFRGAIVKIGAAGCASVGMIQTCGNPGQPNTGGNQSGMGGGSFWASGGQAAYISNGVLFVGGAGLYGGGGGGGQTSSVTSGAGGNGVIIAIEF